MPSSSNSISISLKSADTRLIHDNLDDCDRNDDAEFARWNFSAFSLSSLSIIPTSSMKSTLLLYKSFGVPWISTFP